MEDFGIAQSATVNDVIVNLTGLSMTEFASYSRFERHNSGPLVDKSSILPTVVVSMLKYIQAKLNEEQCSIEDVCKKNDLRNIKFLPVKLPSKLCNQYALVKPTQVLYTALEPFAFHIDSFYPFLHPLIYEAHGVIDILSHVGVQSSITFSHIQLVLELVKSKCQDNKVDVNIKQTVLKSTDELIKLLLHSGSKGDVAQCLKPLYLLSQDNKMVECSKLIVFDVAGLRQLAQIPLCNGYAFINPMKDENQVKSKLLYDLLPKELGLKSLKSMLDYEIIDNTQSEKVYPNVSIIGDILLSKEFKLGIELLGRCNSTDGSVPALVSNIIEAFQNNVTIKHLDNLNIKPMLKIDHEIIHFDKIISHWNFLLQKCNDQTWILSLKNTTDIYPPGIFTNLAKQLCARLKLNTISCFDSSNNDDILELREFVSLMLQSRSISKVVEVIDHNIPEYYTNDLDLPSQFFNYTMEPELGDTIADYWHFRLDQDLFNLFRPEEWVGYETQCGDIAYARILHEIEQDSTDNYTQKMMQRKFLIDVGNDDPIEAHVLLLYKFIQSNTVSFQDNIGSDVEVYSGSNISQSSQITDFEAITDAVKAAFTLPNEQQQKAIKRLYLKHHPDKNSSSNATAEFQFLMEQIAKATEEASRSSVDGRQASASSYHSCYGQWNQTAFKHKKFKTTGGHSSAWNIPNPCIDLREAQVWIKQAYYDYTALCVLKTASEIDDEVSAATCFMSHEVAEKSLKAGMYAKCGLSKESLSKHDVIVLARALVNLQCPVDVTDAHFVEKFYLNSRFPNRYTPSAAPGDQLHSHTALQAFEAATRIFEVMKQVIADDT